MSLISPDLARILACPADLGDLEEDEAGSRLVCRRCGRQYPVQDGIPVMLVDPEDVER